MTKETKETTGTAVAKIEPTISEKFTRMVIREYSSIAGELDMNAYERKLAQHLFIKIDVSLQEQETKRQASNQTGRQPIVWQNINMQKLAIDAVHRIELGLDALIANHIWPIPYYNTKGGKYDLDLRVGYAGKDYYRRKMAVEAPLDIIYELVYSNDTFKPIKRDLKNPVESYQFDIANPFDRGEIVGGFGYIMYEDERKNILVTVSEKDFQKSRALAKSNEFWEKNPVQMRYKTLVLRTTDKLQVDPRKINESYLAVEAADDESIEAEMKAEITEKANKEVIVIETGEETNGGTVLVEDEPDQEKELPKSNPESKPITKPSPASKPQRKSTEFPTIASMREICRKDFGITDAQINKELHVTNDGQISITPYTCYLQIAAVYGEQPSGPEF